MNLTFSYIREEVINRMSIIILAYAIVITIYAAVTRISLLSILLYYADRHISLPDDNEIQKYTIKACKKLFHIHK